MTKRTIYLLSLLCALGACSSSDDDNKDMTYPEIIATNSDDFVAVPADCEVFERGGIIPLNYLLKDNDELGSFTVDIHNNFSHHSHSTTITECELDEKKQPVNPWKLSKDYKIDPGQKTYRARQDIAIPADIDPGDYHFMVTVTDRTGWTQLHAVSIKIK